MVDYLSPIKLQENMHKFVLSKEDRAKVEKDKTPKEVVAAIKELQKNTRMIMPSISVVQC
jgi:hypothetical protein